VTNDENERPVPDDLFLGQDRKALLHQSRASADRDGRSALKE
jgi:hypothetical protein